MTHVIFSLRVAYQRSDIILKMVMSAATDEEEKKEEREREKKEGFNILSTAQGRLRKINNNNKFYFCPTELLLLLLALENWQYLSVLCSGSEIQKHESVFILRLASMSSEATMSPKKRSESCS